MTRRPPDLAPPDAAPSSEPSRGRNEGPRARDLLVVLAVPAILVGLFALPASIRQSFVLTEWGPSVGVVLAHFVHRAPGHLLGNVAAYLLVALGAYYLSALAGHRGEFYAAFSVFLVVFPVVLSALSRPFVDVGSVFGFSGVLMAFLGLVPVALALYLADELDGAHLDHSAGLFFLGAAVIASRAIPDPRLGAPIAGLAVLSAALYLLPAVSRGGLGAFVRVDRLDLVLGVVAVFFLILFAAFPADPATGSRIVNVYVHALGYGLGYGATYLALRLAPAIEGWTRSATSSSPVA